MGNLSLTKKTVKDIDVKNKRVIVRVDFNVPLDDRGHITDDYRIKKAIPTIKYLLEHNAKVILCSHLGRPEGKIDKKFSLDPVAERLGRLLGKEVRFAQDCIGEEALQASAEIKSGEILLLENLRFHAEEENNDPAFAQSLAKLADIYVDDAFGVIHREHASLVGITKFLPSVAGLLVEHEINTITEVMENPKRPLMAVIGGAKIGDKIEILNRLIDIADFVAIGGAMANTFLLAEGVNVAKSMVDKSEVSLAKEIITRARNKAKKQHFVFYIPQDGVVATSLDKTAKTRIVDWDAHVIAAVENYPKQAPKRSSQIQEDEMILDIGPFSGAFIAGGMQLANTVIWNGAMGVTETPSILGPTGPFSHGTELVVDAMLGEFGHKPFSLLGGGDTVGYVEDRNLTSCFDHVSTGGGASLELMSGKKLPGVEALEDKK